MAPRNTFLFHACGAFAYTRHIQPPYPATKSGAGTPQGGAPAIPHYYYRNPSETHRRTTTTHVRLGSMIRLTFPFQIQCTHRCLLIGCILPDKICQKSGSFAFTFNLGEVKSRGCVFQKQDFALIDTEENKSSLVARIVRVFCQTAGTADVLVLTRVSYYRRTIVIKTYCTYKKLYIPVFLRRIFGPDYYYGGPQLIGPMVYIKKKWYLVPGMYFNHFY